jgi:hypothetical protein
MSQTPVPQELLLEGSSHPRGRSTAGDESADIQKDTADLHRVSDASPKRAQALEAREDKQGLQALALGATWDHPPQARQKPFEIDPV